MGFIWRWLTGEGRDVRVEEDGFVIIVQRQAGGVLAHQWYGYVQDAETGSFVRSEGPVQHGWRSIAIRRTRALKREALAARKARAGA